MKYRKSTIYDAVQVPNPDDLESWGRLAVWMEINTTFPWHVSPEKGIYPTDFRGDRQHAGVGDYLVSMGNGTLRFYSRSIFEALHEAVVEQ